MKYYLNLSLVIIFLYSCGKDKKNGYKEGGADYKYEYRTGTSGEYEYNYDVIGEDEEGEEVSGNVDTQGKYGEGTIIDSYGKEREVETEWVDYGVMEATDEDGNVYRLEVE